MRMLQLRTNRHKLPCSDKVREAFTKHHIVNLTKKELQTGVQCFCLAMARLWAASSSSLPTVTAASLASSFHLCRLPLKPKKFGFRPQPVQSSCPSPSSSFSCAQNSQHRGLSAEAVRFLRPFCPLRLPSLHYQQQQQQRTISFGVGNAMAGGKDVLGSTKFKNREILVQHLLVAEDQLQLLLDLQRRIMQEGVDLSDLATEHSICASKSVGGMLGWISLGRTVPEFEEAAFKAPLNKLVRVKTKHGWHLLQVLSEREESFLRDLDVVEFSAHMEDPEIRDDAQLIDVREPDEIATASIEGFKAYPLSQFGKWAPSITEDLDPGKDTYVLCHHGMRSAQAAQWLQSQGFTRLYNIKGGIHAYSVKVDETVPKY